jgi:beta-amylase
MQASLSARAQILGMQEWGNGGPAGSEGSQQNIEETTFFALMEAPYGRFFLEWYSGMLLLHGERLCMIADAVLWYWCDHLRKGCWHTLALLY